LNPADIESLPGPSFDWSVANRPRANAARDPHPLGSDPTANERRRPRRR
jgi:hypothetical protein